jgi:hypothetical protein
VSSDVDVSGADSDVVGAAPVTRRGYVVQPDGRRACPGVARTVDVG